MSDDKSHWEKLASGDIEYEGSNTDKGRNSGHKNITLGEAEYNPGEGKVEVRTRVGETEKHDDGYGLHNNMQHELNQINGDDNRTTGPPKSEGRGIQRKHLDKPKNGGLDTENSLDSKKQGKKFEEENPEWDFDRFGD